MDNVDNNYNVVYPADFPEQSKIFQEQLDDDFKKMRDAFFEFSSKYGNLIASVHLRKGLHNGKPEYWDIQEVGLNGELLNDYIFRFQYNKGNE